MPFGPLTFAGCKLTMLRSKVAIRWCKPTISHGKLTTPRCKAAIWRCKLIMAHSNASLRCSPIGLSFFCHEEPHLMPSMMAVPLLYFIAPLLDSFRRSMPRVLKRPSRACRTAVYRTISNVGIVSPGGEFNRNFLVLRRTAGRWDTGGKFFLPEI